MQWSTKHLLQWSQDLSDQPLLTKLRRVLLVCSSAKNKIRLANQNLLQSATPRSHFQFTYLDVNSIWLTQSKCTKSTFKLCALLFFNLILLARCSTINFFPSHLHFSDTAIHCQFLLWWLPLASSSSMENDRQGHVHQLSVPSRISLEAGASIYWNRYIMLFIIIIVTVSRKSRTAVFPIGAGQSRCFTKGLQGSSAFFHISITFMIRWVTKTTFPSFRSINLISLSLSQAH